MKICFSHNHIETEWTTKSSLGHRQEEEEREEVDMEEGEEEKVSSGPMLNINKQKEHIVKKPSFGGRANPFKVRV